VLAGGYTYVVRGQVGVVALDPVVQDGDHHVPAGVAPLPRRHDVHLRPAARLVGVAVVVVVVGGALTRTTLTS